MPTATASSNGARVSAADRQLIARLETKLASAAELQQFVAGHLAAVYGLQPGDTINDDGRIVPAPAPVLPMAPEPTPAPAAPEPTPAE